MSSEPRQDEGAGPAGDEPAKKRRPSRRVLVLLIAPIVALSVAGMVANAFIPALAADHPLLLIVLDARNRQLVLAREVSIVPFTIVAIIRRMLSDPLFFLLGRLYGDAAVRWLEKKGGGGTLVTYTEKLFKKKWASYPMVFFFPGAIVCALAGATGMPAAVFLALNLLGTITAVAAVRMFSDVVANPVEDLIGFFDRNQVATTTVTVALVLVSLLLSRLQGKLDVSSVDQIEDELTAKPDDDARRAES